MRAVIQRVTSARVRVGQQVIGEIGTGLFLLAAVEKDDSLDDVKYISAKVRDLRVFGDADGKMNLSLSDVGGSVLAVSQFTLCGDCRRGRRPPFDTAASPPAARTLFDDLVGEMRASSLDVQTGAFQAHMDVELVNDGPVTLLLDSRRRW